MSAKEYLRQYRYIKMQIESIKESKEAAYSFLISCGIDPAAEHLSGGKGNSRDAALAAYLDYSEKLDRKCYELLKLQKEIESFVSQVEEPLQTLLRRYYIDGYSWERVSEFLHYSKFWVIKRLHPDALRAVEEIRKKAEG